MDYIGNTEEGEPSNAISAKWPGHAFWAVAVILGLGLYAAVARFGMDQFGGWDYSALIDYAWRQYVGQHPYRDFIATYPPGWFLPAWWAYVLLGVSWWSLVQLAAGFGLSSFLAQAFLLRRLEWGSFWCLLIPFTVQAMSNILLSFWWYNNTAAIFSVLYMTAILLLLKQPASKQTRAIYVVSLAVLGLQKPNVAGPLIILTVLGLLVLGRTRKFTLCAIVCSLVLSCAMLLLCGINPFDMINTYIGISGARDPRWDFYFICQDGFAEACLALSVAVIGAPFLKAIMSAMQAKRMPAMDDLGGGAVLYMLVCAVVVTTYASLTNSELRTVDATLLLTASSAVVLANGTSPKIRSQAAKVTSSVVLLLCCVALIALGFDYGAQRFRLRSCGYYSPGQSLPVENEFFRGLKASPEFVETVSQTNDAVAQYRREGLPDSKIYFGPRMEWAYCAYGIKTPNKLPISWWIGVLYFNDAEQNLINAWHNYKFEMCIFSRRMFENFPVLVRKYLREEYSATRLSGIIIERRKASAPGTTGTTKP